LSKGRKEVKGERGGYPPFRKTKKNPPSISKSLRRKKRDFVKDGSSSCIERREANECLPFVALERGKNNSAGEAAMPFSIRRTKGLCCLFCGERKGTGMVGKRYRRTDPSFTQEKWEEADSLPSVKTYSTSHEQRKKIQVGGV